MPRKKSKSSKRATQSQVVKVNVKNIIQQIKERQGDMIQVKRKRPMDNFNTGGSSRLVAPQMSYGNPMPIFLPVQERTIYVAPEEKAIGNSVIPSRPNLVAQETNPVDIVPSRPSVVAFRPSNPVPSPYGRQTPEQIYRQYEQRARATLSAQATSSQPPTPIIPKLLNESEDLVARSMDEESRALERFARDQYRRQDRAVRAARQTAHGVPMAPASGFPTPPSASDPAPAPVPDEPRRLVIEED
jgi:hypothetical protein